MTYKLKNAKLIILSFSLLLATVFGAAFMTSPSAIAGTTDEFCKGIAVGGGGRCNPDAPDADNGHGVNQQNIPSGQTHNEIQNLLITIVNILTLIVGVVAVIMIIVSGFRFMTSGGESSKVEGAKNGILYAIIGIIIVALAQIIIRFVINRALGAVGNGSPTG